MLGRCMRFMEDAGRSGGDTKRYEREIKRFLGDGGKSMGDTDRYTESGTETE
jgi:general stress protein YciG